MLISPAFAQGAPGAGPGYEQFFIIIGMFALLYFLMIRPQMKRAKEHKQMTEALQKGDEVITSGGVLGKVTKIGETYVSMEIAEGTFLNWGRMSVKPASCSRIPASLWPSNTLSITVNCHPGEGLRVQIPYCPPKKCKSCATFPPS